MRMTRVEPKDGQESVWDYPRPPLLQQVVKRIRIVFNGETIADTTRAWRVLETSHPPTYYLPLEDIRQEFLIAEVGSSYCEWKGRANYYSVRVGDKTAENAAWYYPNPTGIFAPIKNAVAFYAGMMDACYVGEEKATPQPGGFYGGWVTSEIVGPFKGEAGTEGW